MITEINIINAALLNLGSDLISSRTQENSKSAKIANQIYDISRQELLRSHPWNFATGRAVLAASTETISFEYSFVFPLPSDCLRVLTLRDPYQEFKVEGRRILTSANTCAIIYIKDVDDTSQFDSLFRNALIHYLSYKMALSLTGSTQIEGTMFKLFDLALRQAKQVDGQEGTSQHLITDTWTFDR